MAKPKRHIWLCACLCGFLIWACEAPHTNPLDPLNPNAKWGKISGTARSSTSEILGNVLVRWNDEFVSTTNGNGFYQFEKIKPRDGWLYYSMAGYLDDSSRIEWNGRAEIVHNITLRKNPVLTGRVQTESFPRQSISDVKVTWHAGQQYTFTDSDGIYVFEQPVQGDGLLTFEKDGFRTFDTMVEWPQSGNAQVDAYLNANPQLEDYTIVTSALNYYSRDPSYEMIVNARLGDSEDDIIAVFIECEPLDIKANLEYNVLKKIFERSFSAKDFGLQSLREIVGFDFDLKVVEASADTFVLAPERVMRVITDEITIESPLNGVPVENDFTIKWEYFDPGFKFTFDVKIYTNDDFTPELVWEQTNIPAEADSIIAHVDEPNDYVWEIWCVDEFNNRSRAKPGTFKLEE